MTGTELLMKVAEGFSQDGEAEDVIVVYTDENRNVFVKGNCVLTRALGLAAYAEEHIKQALNQSIK